MRCKLEATLVKLRVAYTRANFKHTEAKSGLALLNAMSATVEDELGQPAQELRHKSLVEDYATGSGGPGFCRWLPEVFAKTAYKAILGRGAY